jgi:hypothetical protein
MIRPAYEDREQDVGAPEGGSQKRQVAPQRVESVPILVMLAAASLSTWPGLDPNRFCPGFSKFRGASQIEVQDGLQWQPRNSFADAYAGRAREFLSDSSGDHMLHTRGLRYRDRAHQTDAHN